MPSLSVQTPGSKLSLRSERVVLTSRDSSQPDVGIPLHELEQVVLAPGASLSSNLIAELLERQIPIHTIDGNGRYLGGFNPASPPRALTRLKQYQLSQTPDLALPLARILIASKILNERRVLQRLHQRRGEGDQHLTQLTELSTLADQSLQASSLDNLRGYEGASSATFMRAWACFLPKEFPFQRRSTRPPANPVNAVISYLSALVYGEVLSRTFTTGLDPALGLLHQPTDDRYSLPLDLMEPFRPAIIFPLALRFFAQGLLTSQSFIPKNPGGWLSPEGRGIVHQQFEKVLNREFLSTHLNHRTTLRQQLRATPLLFKAALSDSQRWSPFLLNGTPKLPEEPAATT